MIRRSLLGLSGLAAVVLAGGCCYKLPCLNCSFVSGIATPIVGGVVNALLASLGIPTT